MAGEELPTDRSDAAGASDEYTMDAQFRDNKLMIVEHLLPNQAARILKPIGQKLLLARLFSSSSESLMGGDQTGRMGTLSVVRLSFSLVGQRRGWKGIDALHESASVKLFVMRSACLKECSFLLVELLRFLAPVGVTMSMIDDMTSSSSGDCTHV